jgi:uncharacterized protein
VDWATSVMSQLSPKDAFLIRVEDVYSVVPGPDLGKKIV